MSDSAHASRYNDPSSAQPQNPSGPACDECRQRKVKCDRVQPACGHCSRNGLLCEASNRVKRVNHTRQLVDDVAGLNERLDNIDDTTQQLMKRMDIITDLLRHSNLTAHTPGQQLSLADATVANEPGRHGKETAHTPDNIAAEGPELVQSDTGLERFYGSFSTHALFYTARKITEAVILQVQNSLPHSVPPEKPLASSPSIVKLSKLLDPAALPRLVQSFNSWTSQPYDEEDLEPLAQPVSLPPYHLLEESLRYFFDDPCLEWPIFRKDSVFNAVQMLYAQHQSNPDFAWRLCLNNIILLSLNSKSETTGTNTALVKLMEKGILTSLVNNAKRAINLTPYLMAPRLVNVQALLSLALVARDFAHYFIFERALFLAFQVASAMGLQEEHGQQALSVSADSERRDVIWTIYALDKHRCFLRGSSCLIYQFECSVNFPTRRNSAFDEYWHAQLRLSCVMEEIYRVLYSPKVQRKTNQQLKASVRECDEQLRAWSSKHNSLLNPGQESWSSQILFVQQLRYSHYASRILVHRRGASAENQQVCLESAREALKIVQFLAQRISGGRQALVVLRRIFNNYSVMAYYELWLAVLHSPSAGHTEDMTLLVDFAKALDSQVNPDYPQAYCARVSRAIRWCTEMVQVIQDIKSPDGAVTQRLQFPIYSPTSQLGAWEGLAPAFFSTSPYGYDFVGGDVMGMNTQMPANIDIDIDVGAGASTSHTYESQSQQQDWTPHSNGSLNTNPLSITSLPGLSGSLEPTGMRYQTPMSANMQNQPGSGMVQGEFYDSNKTHTTPWSTR